MYIFVHFLLEFFLSLPFTQPLFRFHFVILPFSLSYTSVLLLFVLLISYFPFLFIFPAFIHLRPFLISSSFYTLPSFTHYLLLLSVLVSSHILIGFFFIFLLPCKSSRCKPSSVLKLDLLSSKEMKEQLITVHRLHVLMRGAVGTC
jgi:hypothetical protein